MFAALHRPQRVRRTDSRACMNPQPRSFLAPNASAMTMGGTITYVVGEGHVAIIDPGCAVPAHLDALAAAVAGAGSAAVIVTHDHPDHAGGAAELAMRLGAPVLEPGAGTLRDGQRVHTDHGELVALATPGHTVHHASLHWPAADAIFCGDLMMGGSDTAVVAAPEGDVGEYLRSLRRLRTLAPRVIYPAHGPPFTDPDTAIDRYIRHREERQRQVLEAVAAGAGSEEEITDRVYGSELDPELRHVARAAVAAYLHHLRRTGRIDEDVKR
jgi:glyoxylase-like metal-dependent hydrolase (beta-lactamase superfamily II)